MCYPFAPNYLETEYRSFGTDEVPLEFFSFQLPYRLHAVLVHEGQASGGHYWAYIQDPDQQRWCKFNDITVSEVTWDEVSRESLGGYRHVSAYCLMYIDARREGCIGAGGSIQELPADLQELVDKDNAEFETEMRDWDDKQLNKVAAQGKSTIENQNRSSVDSLQGCPVMKKGRPDVSIIRVPILG